MKALYYDGDKAALINDYPNPELGPGESLIRILLAAVCSTDREVMRGYKPDFKGVMGHEFVGVVERSPDPALVGKTVVGELNAGCGDCIYCNTGRSSHCETRRVLGMVDKDGCFAEYMTIQTKLLHIVPDGMTPETALFTEPLAAALEIAELSHIKPSMEAAVIGDGRLSYMISQALALSGARITVIGRHAEKLNAFKGFAKTLDAPEGSYELVVDATGSPSGLLTAVKLVRSRGLIVLKSTYAGDLSINMSELVVREITVRGSRCGPFEPALALLSRGLITLPEASFYTLDDYENAFSAKKFKVGFQISNKI